MIQQDSITLPCSFPLGPNLRKQDSITSDETQSTTSSKSDNGRRKRRLQRTKSRMALPTPRRATSGPKASARKLKSSKSKSFERLNEEVKKTIKPSSNLSIEDRIFVNQLEKLSWTREFRTELVAARDTAERASVRASEKMGGRDERLAKLLDEEKEARKQLEKETTKKRLRDVTRKMEQRQRRAEIEKATRAMEEQVKRGQIRRERTLELMRVLSKSELDIMAGAQADDQQHLRVELEKIATTRKQLAEEQIVVRQQVEEVAKARAELEGMKQCLQTEEEAARAQAAQATSQFNEMLRAYHQLQQHICQLQEEKDAAQRKSDDILFQARMETRRIRNDHEKALRQTQEESARSMAEAVFMFQARLDAEAGARRRAEEHAVAAIAAAEAYMAPASAPTDPQHWQLQAPPPYESTPPSPQDVLTNADRIILYERKWEALKGDTEIIFFQQVPWPILTDLLHPDQLDVADIRNFITHEAYLCLPGMEGKPLRERIKAEMLRWHPDKFEARVLPKVEPTHRQAVKATADKVVRMLTHLMRDISA